MKSKKVSVIALVAGIVIVITIGCLLLISQFKNIIFGSNKVNVIFELGVKYTEEEADMYLKALENDLKDAPAEVADDVNVSDVFDSDNVMTIPVAYADITVGKESMKTDEKGMIIVRRAQIDEIKDICEKYAFEFIENGDNIIARKEIIYEEYVSGISAFTE